MSQKGILLVGNAGKGKSTTGNCLHNQSSDENQILYEPFQTSNTAKSCTQEAKIVVSSNFKIIDTVGFADPTKTSEECLKNMTDAINKVDNKIDLIIYVFHKDRFKNDDVEFLKLNMNYLKNKLPNSNSLVLINKCYKGWIETKCKTNRDLNNAIHNCNGNYFEFNLRFYDEDEDKPHYKEEYRQQRQDSINELVAYVKQLCQNNKFNSYNYNDNYIRHRNSNSNRIQTARILCGRNYFS